MRLKSETEALRPVRGRARGDCARFQLAGQASVIDGDMLEIHETRIRPGGIDAPESSQLFRGEDSLPYRCGAKAANELDSFIARRPVDCEPVSLDVYWACSRCGLWRSAQAAVGGTGGTGSGRRAKH
jgi:endonuclease YncB( thermonuclease family)